MNTVKIDSKATKIVAHRGLSGIEKENTCAAFVAAGNRSYYGVETDIHCVADGEFVVMHDSNPSRISNGKYDLTIEEHTWDELREIVLPDRDGSTNRIDIRVPRLIDYISICRKYEKECILEIKGRFSRENLIRVVELIKGLDYLEHVIFIAFDIENCKVLRELLPENRIQWLSDTLDNAIIEKAEKQKLDLDVNYNTLNEKYIKLCHSKGIKVNCWTCDSKEDAEKLICWGVDFITSNILEGK